ncbi:ATP-dependent DNA helicase UvrD/PcrA [hydrothermal vent metagenome]|uniref:DNA 3'-5' helicase n=1 Tax=hydrothermal vent metagenome TaxID=652676 RepID=A0A3B1D7R0_9ZZZZ
MSDHFSSPEVRVVEASAGSGKTYALAKRYVQLVLNPEQSSQNMPIRQILALTFTNKAAFEMKVRILEFLKRIVFKDLSAVEVKDILEPLGLDANRGSRSAFGVMEDVIHHYNFFQVQTIDKFINSLLSGCAFKIGLTANFKIKTNVNEYLQYSLDKLIDRAPYEKGIFKVFEDFLHNYLYLENRTGWFPKDDILGIVGALFHQNNAYGQGFAVSAFSAEDVIKRKKLILVQMKELELCLPEQTYSQFRRGLTKFLTEHSDGFDIDSVSDYFAREELPVRKGGMVSREAEQLWGEITTHLRKLCEQEAVSLFNPYVHIFDHVLQEFYAASAKDDCLFLSELNKRASALFDEDRVTVEELYYRLATRFHHYLIDEFQDTSRLQWRNLDKMAEEALSTGGTLFYVGDRKQAIYGFRGGDASLFDDVKQEFHPFNVKVDCLTQNWRSQKAIVEFNNSIFSMDNLRRFIEKKQGHEQEKKKKNPVVFNDKDMRKIENVFGSAQQVYQSKNQSGYVEVEYIDIAVKEERDEVIRHKVFEVIEDVRKRFDLKDIAILTRSNTEVELLTNWLLEENILVESERTSNVQENFLIQELIAFLKFLDSPIDNLSFTIFILGEIFSKATKIPSEELHKFVFSLREKLRKQTDVYVYMEFRSAYGKIWDNFVDEFFKNVGLYPLYELMITIYSKFQCLQNFQEYQGFLMHFLELIKKQEEEHSDIISFLNYFEDLKGEGLYVHVTDSDAIKILTIHKSKGLEFPVVIIPFLGMDVQVGSSGADQQQSYIMQMQEGSIELLRLKSKYLRFSDDLYQIYAKQYKEALISELNNVYVALTRPEKELYVYIPKRTGNSFNPARFLISEEYYESGVRSEGKKEQEKLVSSVAVLPCSEYHDWIGYLKEEFCRYDQFRNRQERFRGEVMHFILSQMGDLSQKDKQVVQEAVSSARQQFAEVDDWDKYQKDILQFLEQEDVTKFFDCPDAKVFTEKEVINAAGHTKRIDRLIVKQDEVWIVDYKTGQDDEARNVKQLQEYEEILKELYLDKAVKGFLVYL